MPALAENITAENITSPSKEATLSKGVLKETNGLSATKSENNDLNEIPLLLREEYFLWGCELSKSCPEVTMEAPTPKRPEHHYLHIRHALLCDDAVEGDRNIVEVRYVDYSGAEKRHRIVALTLGREEFARLDMTVTWDAEHPLTLRLIKGSGPLTISGNHIVDRSVDSCIEEDEASKVEEQEKMDEDHVPKKNAIDKDTKATDENAKPDELAAKKIND